MVPAGVYSARHLYVVRVPAERHRSIFESLRSEGVGVNVHYIPVYRQPEYRRLGFREGHCPASEQYYREAITLPLYPAMTEEQQHRVIDGVTRALEAAARAA
jgi:dTDP-4-amino-4,6-dideoxygalactose transaminase